MPPTRPAPGQPGQPDQPAVAGAVRAPLTRPASPGPARRRRRRQWVPYALMAPAVAAIVLVQAVPIGASIIMSVLRVNQFTIGNLTQAPAVGWGNYRVAVGSWNAISQALLVSFGYTLAYTVVVVATSWALGMAAAVFLADALPGRRLLGSVFLLAYALPTFVAVTIWTFLFQPHGAVNHLIGVDTFWFAGPQAFWAMCVNTVWRTWPFVFLMLLPAVQAIPTELYEAARVDGASRWGEFVSITLPSTRNVGLLVALVVGFWTFSDFTTPYLMFSSAAPTSADLLSLVIYRTSFVNLNFGLGTAMSLVMVVFLIGVSMVYLRVLRLDVEEAST